MPVTIVGVRRASDAEWDSCWEGCDFATYFQSREWMEMWRGLEGNGGRLETRVIDFSDGGHAIVPMCTRRVHKGLVKLHSLSAGGGYGGWLSTDQLELQHACRLTKYLRDLGNIEWLTNPCDPLVLSCGLASEPTDEAHIVALHGDMNSTLRKFTKGHRSAIQKARRSGVSVRKAESIDDWRNYYDIYRDSVRRWGESATSNHRYEMFEALCDLKSENVVLWLSIYEERIISGAICLYARKHVSYWHGAALETYFELRPVNLLIHEAMSDASARGFAWFDLGLSGGHEGVRSFKRSFGASAAPSVAVAESTVWRRIIGAAARLSEQGAGSRPSLVLPMR